MAVWRNRVLNQQIVVVGALLAAGPGLRAGRIRHLQDFETGQGEDINLDNVLDYDSGTDVSGQRNPEKQHGQKNNRDKLRPQEWRCLHKL